VSLVETGRRPNRSSLSGEDSTVDFDRWPAMRTPAPAPTRAAIAKVLLRNAASRTGIEVVFPGGSRFGRSGGPVLELVRPAQFFDRLGRDGKIGFGEAYMAGDWKAEDLAGLLSAMAARMRTLIPPRLQWVRRFYEPSLPPEEDNDPSGSVRNIQRHYDLSNELFALFLDPSMTYSSALYDRPGEPLAEAQARKIDRLLDETRVGPGAKVLEIGTGWGELAIRAARRGAKVTSLTLSVEQATLARKRIAEEGLSHAVDVRVEDYRSSAGAYDAVVSVEMVEAVGERWWPTYFSTLEARLAPGGRVGLQTILMRHDGFIAARNSWTWIHKYIFPGGMIPSMEAMEGVLRTSTHLRVLQRHHFGASYAETLATWREKFMSEEDAVDRLGFDRTFRRMWEFYLAYSEAGFRSGYLDVAQIVMASPT